MGEEFLSGDVLAARVKSQWALITGQAAGTNRYAWSPVNDADTSFPSNLASGFGVGGTSDTTGWPAYEITGRTDVPADSTEKVRLYPSAAGSFWIFKYEGAGTGASYSTGTGGGWLAGLPLSSCLKFSILSAAGKCSGVTTPQTIYLTYDSGDTRWESTADFTGTGSGGAGPAHVGTTDGVPYCTIDGVYGTLEPGGSNYLIFAFGGSVLCGGTDSLNCGDNTLRVKVECYACDASYSASIVFSASAVPVAGGTASCCSRALNEYLLASLSGGEGTLLLTWDAGNTRWAGSKALSCGETLYLRYSTGCGLTYSCDNVTYAPATRDLTPVSCGPPASDGVYTLDMDDVGAGCAAGSCGSITATITE